MLHGVEVIKVTRQFCILEKSEHYRPTPPLKEGTMLRIVGYTIENKPVFSGVFELMGTHGVPLEIILDKFSQDGRTIDWLDYITAALNDGHNPRTIRTRILTAVGDVLGAHVKKEFEKKLDLLKVV